MGGQWRIGRSGNMSPHVTHVSASASLEERGRKPACIDMEAFLHLTSHPPGRKRIHPLSPTTSSVSLLKTCPPPCSCSTPQWEW